MHGELDLPTLDPIFKFSANEVENSAEVEIYVLNRYRAWLLAHNIQEISGCMIEPINIFNDLTDQFILFLSSALQ